VTELLLSASLILSSSEQIPTFESYKIGDGLQDFSLVKKDIFCKPSTLNGIKGNVCFHGDDGRIIDGGWWTTGYTSNTKQSYDYIYYTTSDPIHDSTMEFTKLIKDEHLVGLQVVHQEQTHKSYEVLVCNKESSVCLTELIIFNGKADSALIVVKRTK
jgi:hypothetical protein